MKKGITILCLIVGLSLSQSSFGSDPAHHNKSKGAANAMASKTFAWNPSPADESVSCYNVYQKIGHGRKEASWKKVGTVCSPSFTVERLSRGPHTFAVTAVSPFGESARSELVVSR